jgi:hypothetical protein
MTAEVRADEGDGWHEFTCLVCRKPGECDGDCGREPGDTEHVHFDAPCWEVGPADSRERRGAEMTALPPCPHGDDPSHGGLEQGWCLAGREAQP